MTKVKKLKALFDFVRVPDETFVSRLTVIHDKMLGNTAFPTPLVDLAVFKTGITNYAAAAAAALDGGKQAKADKKKQHEALVKMAEQLGHYVEANSNDDPATFTSSGFEIRPTTRVPPQPLAGEIFRPEELRRTDHPGRAVSERIHFYLWRVRY